MKEEKYKVGDKVLLKNKRGNSWNCYGEMDCYKGKVVTISGINDDKKFCIKEDNRDDLIKWWFDFDDIERKVSSKKHFKSLPKDYTGTIEVENGFIIEKEILDEIEKEYLSDVIKPFRNKIKYICKKKLLCYHNYKGKEYIEINLKYYPIYLPFFKENTMYKGMEINKRYTLEELGL